MNWDFKQWLSVTIILLSFGISILLFFVQLPEGNKEYVSIIIGFFLGQGFSQVVKYWYNSNDQSEKKTEIIREMAQEKNKLQ